MGNIVAELRNPTVKAKRLRRGGKIPCAVYGGTLKEPLLIQMDERTAENLLREKREGSKVRLEVDGRVITSQIKEVSRNCVSRDVEHISFQALSADRKVNSIAQVLLLNKDSVQGIVEQMLFEIPYSAYPEDMIDTVTVDLENHVAGDQLTVGELEAFKNKNIDLHVDADALIYKIIDRKHTAEAESAGSSEKASAE